MASRPPTVTTRSPPAAAVRGLSVSAGELTLELDRTRLRREVDAELPDQRQLQNPFAISTSGTTSACT